VSERAVLGNLTYLDTAICAGDYAHIPLAGISGSRDRGVQDQTGGQDLSARQEALGRSSNAIGKA
jgi:hypothetical protein